LTSACEHGRGRAGSLRAPDSRTDMMIPRADNDGTPPARVASGRRARECTGILADMRFSMLANAAAPIAPCIS
jgi:hypothetical protein